MNKLQREIILDVETTGLSFREGDRIVEIACLEVLDGRNMGKTFHSFVNPGRSVSQESFAIHGLSESFLQDKPKFTEIAFSLSEFLADCKIIAHNALFDIGFLNSELQKAGLIGIDFLRVIDSLQLARAKISGRSHSLDSLALHFGVLSKKREKHDALSDVKILFQIYCNLTLESEPKILFLQQKTITKTQSFRYKIRTASVEELNLHRSLTHKINQNIW